MLVAEHQGERVEAEGAARGLNYVCPECKGIVILKLGRIVISAFELQHTSIGLDEIEERAFSYDREGIAQIWIPFIKSSVLTSAERQGPGRLFIEKYSPRPFEKWVHGFCIKDGMWMYAPTIRPSGTLSLPIIRFM